MILWAEFALAIATFAASHFLPSQGHFRARLIGAMGRPTYFTVYGAISVLVLIWLIGAAGRAPHVALWSPDPWTRWIPNLIMPIAILLMAMACGNRFPFTLGGRQDRSFDPRNPGLAALTRHPLPLSLALWSGAHIPPNGDLAHVLLFGGFVALSLGAIPVFDRRARAALSAPMAADLFRAAPVLRPTVLWDKDWLQSHGRGLVGRLVLTAFIWGAIYALHQQVIGVSPAV